MTEECELDLNAMVKFISAHEHYAPLLDPMWLAVNTEFVDYLNIVLWTENILKTKVTRKALIRLLLQAKQLYVSQTH